MITREQLDDFTRAYIEAALWSSNDDATPSGGEPLDGNYGIEDIDPDTLAKWPTIAAASKRKTRLTWPCTIIRNGPPPSWAGMTSG